MKAIDKLDMVSEQIKNIVERMVPAEGIFSTPVPSLFFVRKKHNDQTDRCFEQPFISVVLQGGKQSVIGSQEFSLCKNSCIVSGIDISSSSHFTRQDQSEDFFSLFVYFDKAILYDLIIKMEKQNFAFSASSCGVSVETAEFDVLECLLRLAELVEKPDQISVRALMILRELHYRVLIGRQGGVLYNLYARSSEHSQIVHAVNFLKRNIARPLDVEQLAESVNMSVSSLYRHFKTVTGFSPLQYQKHLRLHEAQRLMLTENERASSAALLVGYESVTQFNREYKRMFGEPPHRDTVKRKNLLFK